MLILPRNMAGRKKVKEYLSGCQSRNGLTLISKPCWTRCLMLELTSGGLTGSSGKSPNMCLGFQIHSGLITHSSLMPRRCPLKFVHSSITAGEDWAATAISLLFPVTHMPHGRRLLFCHGSLRLLQMSITDIGGMISEGICSTRTRLLLIRSFMPDGFNMEYSLRYSRHIPPKTAELCGIHGRSRTICSS